MSEPKSPSATTTWKKCPVLYQLTQQGIVRRELGKRELAAALGSAFAQGMHVYHRGRQAGVEPSRAPVDAALGWWAAQREAWDAEGRTVLDRDQSQLASVERRVVTLVTHAIDHDPLPPEWQVVAVEQSLGPGVGNARPDLVCQKPDGARVVIDYKTTLTLGTRADERARKLTLRLDEWRTSDQLYHYAWAVGTTHVVIAFAEVEPKPSVTLHDFWFPGSAVDLWHDYQEDAWNMMAMAGKGEGDGLVWRAAVHGDAFGPCEMTTWCFGDPLERDGAYTVRTRGL